MKKLAIPAMLALAAAGLGTAVPANAAPAAESSAPQVAVAAQASAVAAALPQPTGHGTISVGAGHHAILRQQATVGSPEILRINDGTQVHIHCKTTGGAVKGNNVWYHLIYTEKTQGYVSATLMKVDKEPNWCAGSAPAPHTMPAYFAPKDDAAPYIKGKNYAGFVAGNCTAFAAFRIRVTLGNTSFDNNGYAGKTPPGGTFSHAKNWDNELKGLGVPVDATPRPGSIAVSNYGQYGHVAFVYQVNADGSYEVEEYNYTHPLGYDKRHVKKGATGLAGFDSFVHFPYNK